jgi:hypothetical protein
MKARSFGAVMCVVLMSVCCAHAQTAGAALQISVSPATYNLDAMVDMTLTVSGSGGATDNLAIELNLPPFWRIDGIYPPSDPKQLPQKYFSRIFLGSKTAPPESFMRFYYKYDPTQELFIPAAPFTIICRVKTGGETGSDQVIGKIVCDASGESGGLTSPEVVANVTCTTEEPVVDTPSLLSCAGISSCLGINNNDDIPGLLINSWGSGSDLLIGGDQTAGGEGEGEGEAAPKK